MPGVHTNHHHHHLFHNVASKSTFIFSKSEIAITTINHIPCVEIIIFSVYITLILFTMEAVINGLGQAADFITNQTTQNYPNVNGLNNSKTTDSIVFLDQSWTTVYSFFFVAICQVAVAFYVAWSLDFIKKTDNIQKQYRETVLYNWVYNFSLACFFGLGGSYLLIYKDYKNLGSKRVARGFENNADLEIVGGNAKLFDNFERTDLFEKDEEAIQESLRLMEIEKNKALQLQQLAFVGQIILHFLCKLCLWSFSVFGATLPLLKINNKSSKFRAIAVRVCVAITVLLAVLDVTYLKVWFIWPIQELTQKINIFEPQPLQHILF